MCNALRETAESGKKSAMVTGDDDGDGDPAINGGISVGDYVHTSTVGQQIIVGGPYESYKKEERSFWRSSSPRKRLKRRLDEAFGEAPDDAMGVLISLIADCDLRAYDSRRASKRWGSAYYFLGLPAAVLATIAGAAGLASTAGRVPAAIIALIAAGLATAATFLNSNENKQQNSKLSAAWQELADDVRLMVVRHGQDLRIKERYGQSFLTDSYLIRSVIYFNKRKSALLRGDLASIPEPPQEPTDVA